MKFKRLLVLATLGAGIVPGLTSCGGKVQVGGAKTVQVRCYEGGYGYEWLTQLANQFNQTFSSEGYKVEIVEHSSLVTDASKEEIAQPTKNQIDLYFTNGSDVNGIINKSKNVLRTSETVLLECLEDDVFNKPAVGFDGKEESQKISERLFKGYKEACQYNGNLTKWQGKLYKLPWAGAMTGLFANKSVLDKYGIQIPLTTNELVAAFQTLSTKSPDVYPYSFAGQGAPGYWSYLFETWFGQYSGQDSFINFMKCMPANGDIKNNGYEVYNDIGILKSMTTMFDILNLDWATDGCKSKSHKDAQNEFVQGKVGFIVAGDWIFNEEKASYVDANGNVKKDDVNIVMVPAPVLSCLGSENGLTDAQLHTVVEAIDARKSNEEIKALVPAASDAAIAKIRDARSIVDSIGPTHDLFIPSYADAKEAAKLFVRYMYSNDGCNLFRKYANSNLPLNYTINDENKANSNMFIESLDIIYNSGDTKVISGSADYNQVRTQGNVLVFNTPEWRHTNTYVDIMSDKKDANPIFTPEKIYKEEAEYVKGQWSSYMAAVAW